MFTLIKNFYFKKIKLLKAFSLFFSILITERIINYNYRILYFCALCLILPSKKKFFVFQKNRLIMCDKKISLLQN